MVSRFKGAFSTGGMAVLLFLSGLLLWLTPLPFIYACKKRGKHAAWEGLVLGFLLLGLLYFGILPWVQSNWGWTSVQKYLFWLPGVGLSPDGSWSPGNYGLPYFGFYGMMGVMLGLWEGKERSPTVLLAKVVGLLSVGVLLWVLWQTRGNLGQFVPGTVAYFQDLLDQMVKAPAKEGGEVQDQMAVLRLYGPKIIYYAVRLIPGMILAMTLFVSWLNVVVARRIFIKDAVFAKLGSLKNWQLPFGFVWALIFAAFLLVADLYLFKVNFLKLFALNSFILFGLIYFFQGLAILAFYSKRWALPPLLRLVFYLVFLLFFQPLSMILLGIGFFDSWFNFRKLTTKAV